MRSGFTRELRFRVAGLSEISLFLFVAQRCLMQMTGRTVALAASVRGISGREDAAGFSEK